MILIRVKENKLDALELLIRRGKTKDISEFFLEEKEYAKAVALVRGVAKKNTFKQGEEELSFTDTDIKDVADELLTCKHFAPRSTWKDNSPHHHGCEDTPFAGEVSDIYTIHKLPAGEEL